MAAIVKIPGSRGPANAGEDIVLHYLAAELSDEFILIPNITIPYGPNRAEEYDIIVVGPDAVFVVEVKTLVGDVEITEQQMFVDGDVRSNPWTTTRIKAQKLASKIELSLGASPKVWVEHVVVLSRSPRIFKCAEVYRDHIFVGADEALPLLLSPSRLINPKGHRLHVGRRDAIVGAISGDATSRVRQRVFKEYNGLNLIHQQPDPNGFEYWAAEHRLHGGARMLQVFRSEGRDRDQHNGRRLEAARRVEIAEKIGPSADVIAPRENFETDAGEYVLVWPVVDSPSLQRYLAEHTAVDEGDDVRLLTDDAARRLLEGFAHAYADAHRAGFVFGKMAPSAYVVRPGGRGAVVLQYPVPQASTDQSIDLEQLLVIAKTVAAHAEQGVCSALVERFETAMSSVVRAEVPSAGWLAAACHVGVAGSQAAPPLVELFEEIREITVHSYGKTYRGKSRRLGHEVAVRTERGRPGRSWVDREASVLSRPEVRGLPGVVQFLQHGVVEEGGFLATEWVDGIPLTALLDAGVFSDVPQAVDAAVQMLEILRRMHPDMRGLTEILDSMEGELGPDELRQIEQLRRSGIAHNHIEPSNVIWSENRGPVLVDFVRAAEFGREIPARLSPYWPTDLSRSQSNPTADLYAVGLIFLMMLTGPLKPQRTGDRVDDRITELRMSSPELAEVVARATSTKPAVRFQSADEFIDALAAFRVDASSAPAVSDSIQLVRRIDSLLDAGRIDDALAICEERGWHETAERLRRKRDLITEQGRELLKVDGVVLSYLGRRDVGPGTTGSNSRYERGEAHVYLAKLDDGGVLELHTVTAKPIDETTGQESLVHETWVQGDLEFGLPSQMRLLAERRRLTVNPLVQSEVDDRSGADLSSYCQIRQLQLKGQGPLRDRWDATTKKVTVEQLNLGAGGINVDQLLRSFGADHFGTREHVIGDKSKLRGDLCVRFGNRAVHVPAVTFLVSRLLPLKNMVGSPNRG
jgi:hypothetical protein